MKKVDRSAFLYLEPRPTDGDRDFAQCDTCRMFVPGGTSGHCIIHGSQLRVARDATCGFWVRWPNGRPVRHVVETHRKELNEGLAASVTPQESGLLHALVQCHRCAHFAPPGRCALFEGLNQRAPTRFDLDTDVDPHGCCNAWTAK